MNTLAVSPAQRPANRARKLREQPPAVSPAQRAAIRKYQLKKANERPDECRTCTQPRLTGYAYCEKHLDANAEGDRARRARRKREHPDLCQRGTCPNKARLGFVSCVKCSAPPRESTARTIAAMVNGERLTMTLVEWAARSDMARQAILSRIAGGWPEDLAVTVPKGQPCPVPRIGREERDPLWTSQR